MSTEKSYEDTITAQKNLGRRRFVRSVGVAVPIVLTVSARSALACHCTTVSAAGSRAMMPNSHNAQGDWNQTSDCAGRSPNSWQTYFASNQTAKGEAIKFKDAFAGSGLDDSFTMKKVITDSSVNEFKKYIAAAYLNSVNDLIGSQYYTVIDLQEMWLGRSGTYQPVTGVNWGTEHIKDYLRPTWQ